jgi:two-component sensor histidine kinase
MSVAAPPPLRDPAELQHLIAGADVALEAGTHLHPKAREAIHEPAANLLKYVSVSAAERRVTVLSCTERRETDRRLVIERVESNGAPVARPTRRGAGARLLEHGLGGELAGHVRLDYLPSGLACRMELPMQGLEASE